MITIKSCEKGDCDICLFKHQSQQFTLSGLQYNILLLSIVSAIQLSQISAGGSMDDKLFRGWRVGHFEVPLVKMTQERES